MDLEIRGPGAIYGQAQHGRLDLKIANLTDMRLIASAREAAQRFIDKDKKVDKYPELAAQVTKYQTVTTLN
jgi:ATP-dependent DNA helicase RecG